MDQPPARIRVWKNRIALALAPAALLGFLWWFEYRNVFQPTRQLDASGDEFGAKPDNVFFTSRDGVKLHGWFYAAPTQSSHSHLAVLLAHGNGGNISHRLSLYQCWLQLGVNVFAFDYRGYGKSEGWPSENGTYLDAQAAYHWLIQRGFAPDQILAHGESLGGGVVTELARREKLAGIILQSTFSSITDLGAELFPFLPTRLLARIRYDNAGKLPQLALPVLVLHSREDSIIPFHHGQKSFAAAQEPKLFREISGDHNDQPDADLKQFSAALNEFLQRVTPPRR